MLKNSMLKVLICMIFTLSSCSKVRSNNDLEKTLKIEIFKNVNGVVDFNKIVYFKWNRLLILTPYTPIKKVESLLNINLKPIEHSGIEFRDDINQLIFFDDDKIVRMVEFQRNYGDFVGTSKLVMINRSDARFRIIKKNDWIVMEHY